MNQPVRDQRLPVLDLLFMGMELCWLAAGLLLLDKAVTPPGQPGLIWLAACYPAAYFLSRGVRRWAAHPAWRFFWAALCLGVGLAVALKFLLLYDAAWAEARALAWQRVFLLLFMGAFSWLRGWILGQRRVDLAGFSNGLQVGLLLLVGDILLAGVLEIALGPARLLIMAFFCCGLLGLWLARLRVPRAGPPSAVRGVWLGVVLASLALVLVVGLFLGGMLDRSILELILQPAVWLWDRFKDFLDWLARLFASDKPPPPMPAIPTGPSPGDLERQAYKSWFDSLAWLRPVAEVIFVGLWVAAIGTVLLQNLLRLARWLARRARNDQAEYESLSADWLAGVRAGLRRLAYLLIAPWRLVWGLVTRRRERLGRSEAAARRIYSRFLLWAAARGAARRPDQTPHEFLAALRGRLPEHGPELEALTRGYVLARYGPGGAPGEAVEGMARAWRKLKKARMLKRSEKRQS